MHLNRLLIVLDETGFNADHILAECGLTRSILRQVGWDILFSTYVYVLDRILDETDLPGLGLLSGARVNPADFGIVGYALMSSADWRAAVSQFIKYQILLGYGIRLTQSLREDARDAFLCARSCVLPSSKAHTYLIEEWLANWCAMFGPVSGHVIDVKLALPRPRHLERYRDLLGCPILFEQDVNEIRLPRSVLDIPLELANDLTASVMELHCAATLSRLEENGGVIEMVRRVMHADFQGSATLESVAQKLRIGPRTLRRYLSDSGTNFNDVRNGLRMTLACDYLSATSMGIQEIGFALGYSEVSSFHRAFRRSIGKTPAAYRCQHSGRSGQSPAPVKLPLCQAGR